jgi:hypothetical protein
LIEKIQKALTDDLLKPQYRGSDKPFYGHCYVATEAYWHMQGRNEGWKPQIIRLGGGTHWYLRRGDEILDITAAQFDTPVSYDRGRGCGFLTKQPSKRAQKVIDRVKEDA